MNNIAALKTPAYLAYVEAEEVGSAIQTLAADIADNAVAQFLIRMEDEFPDYLDKLASDAPCADLIKEALLERTKYPKPHEAAIDAYEQSVREPEDQDD